MGKYLKNGKTINQIAFCKRCGKEFTKTHRQPRQIYCSVECRIKTKKEKYEKEKRKNHKEPVKTFCKQCGQGFDKQSNKLYCSVKCRNIYDENQKEMTMFDIFEHDNFRCQYCGKTPNDGIELVVDHIYPVSKGGKSDRFNLTTACVKCNSSKASKILSLEETIRRWDSNPREFTYIAARDFWDKTQIKRENILKNE